MANAEKALPSTVLELDGDAYKLVFDFEALCMLEEKTGINALDGDVWKKPSASQISVLLWAALQKHHPEQTVEAVRKKISFKDMDKIALGLSDAFEKASPKGDDSEKKE